MSDDNATKIKQLEQAIAAQESLRGILDDEIVNATIDALRKQLAELERPSEAEHQRKLMTVMFMDVVSSTRLFAELDPEENLAIMDDALERLAQPIERLGGRVLRFMGDGYLAVFGLPRARENDPEMAVRAGLRVLETAEMIAGELKTERELEGFQVRIGVNTGLVVAGGVTEGEGTIMGTAVNLASRLENAAPPGGLLISQYTYDHVRGLFEFGQAESLQVKGIDKPVQAYLVEGLKKQAFRLKTRGVEGIETPMIGREAELNTLQKAMAEVNQTRRRVAITVVGDAGLGKSRLLVEFENWLVQQEFAFELLKGRATLESLDLPYHMVRDLFNRRVGIMDDDPVPEVRRKIVEDFQGVMVDEPNLERNAHFVGQLLGYDFRDSPHLKGVLEDPRQIHDRALMYLADYLKALSNGRSLVIFLDDVHWADGTSLDLFLQLFEELAKRPVLVVALTRSTLFERRPSWGQAEVEGFQRIDLRPLSPQESSQLVGEVLQKVQDLPDELRDLITENAEGNPFYLEELIRMLVEDGVIVKSEPYWQVLGDRLGNLHIPPTLTGVIQARLDGLPEQERKILQRASVIGKVFWDEAVCYLDKDDSSGQARQQMDAKETKQRLGTLQSRELIFEHGTSVFSDAVEYLFKHAVLRDVTYESVLKSMRRVYHALVADWLIAHTGERTNEVTGLIAGHLEKAGKMEEAVEYLQKAARLASSNYAMDEAAEFYTRALALLPEKDLEKHFTIILGRKNVFRDQGNRNAERVDLESLTTLADRLSDDNKRAEASMGWAWYYYWTSKFPATITAAEQALSLARTTEQTDLEGQAYYATAWASLQMRQFDNALNHAEMMLELARKTENQSRERDALTTLGSIHNAVGNYSASRNHHERGLGLARESGDLSQEGHSLTNLGVTLTLLGDYQKAREMYQRYFDIICEMGNPIGEATALINLGWVCAAQGDWDMAKDYAHSGSTLAKKIGYIEAAAEGLNWLGHAWLGLGQTAEAIAAYQESLEFRRKLNQPNLAMGVLAGLSQAAMAQGDLTAAKKPVEEILTFLAEGGTLDGTWEPLRIYLTCFQLLDRVGDPRAEEVLEEAHRFLMKRADRISDEDDRRSYLENVPWHRELNEAWEARKKQH